MLSIDTLQIVDAHVPHRRPSRTLSESTIQIGINRISGELGCLYGSATDALTGTRSNAEGSPETLMAAVRSKLAENRLTASARHASLDAGFHSSVGA